MKLKSTPTTTTTMFKVIKPKTKSRSKTPKRKKQQTAAKLSKAKPSTTADQKSQKSKTNTVALKHVVHTVKVDLTSSNGSGSNLGAELLISTEKTKKQAECTIPCAVESLETENMDPIGPTNILQIVNEACHEVKQQMATNYNLLNQQQQQSTQNETKVAKTSRVNFHPERD